MHAKLLLESLDADTYSSNTAPVTLTSTLSSGGIYKNILNSFMDHTWDGFFY